MTIVLSTWHFVGLGAALLLVITGTVWMTGYLRRITLAARLFVPTGDRLDAVPWTSPVPRGHARVSRLKRVSLPYRGQTKDVCVPGGEDDYVEGTQYLVLARGLPLADEARGSLFTRHTVLLTDETPVQVYLWNSTIDAPPESEE